LVVATSIVVSHAQIAVCDVMVMASSPARPSTVLLKVARWGTSVDLGCNLAATLAVAATLIQAHRVGNRTDPICVQCGYVNASGTACCAECGAPSEPKGARHQTI
jgi:hypothetical protein